MNSTGLVNSDLYRALQQSLYIKKEGFHGC